MLAPLEPLFPDGGLRRGSTVAVDGSTSLAIALAAGASGAGSWCAAVGAPALGLVAAAELGVDLARFPLVAGAPAAEWPTVVAALLDAIDVVLARVIHLLGGRVFPGRQSRARFAVRDSDGTIELSVHTAAGSADVRLRAEHVAWEGLGQGHGRLTAHLVDLVAGGRRAWARERRVRVWLPGFDGRVRSCHEERALSPLTVTRT